ncbi:MAG: carboxylesterase family protein, partial [Clostridia bacterium]|nr:carboxylesterase family protein [Clostridia bacterium]
SLGWHSGELWYMFNNMGYSFEGMDAEWQPAWEVYDYMVGETTSSYWSNFAKNENPNAPGLVNWPAADAENQPYQYIDVVTTTFDTLTPFDQMVMEYYTNLYGLN